MSKYVKDNEWSKYPNFKKEEFKCPCCGGYGEGIAKSLVETLQNLRTKKGKAITISSGYRCSNYNKRVGGISNSKHLYGMAADFYFNDGSLGNQNTRVALVNELKGTQYYNYAYCNVNGNYPNMGAAIHLDTKLIDVDVAELQGILNQQYNYGLVVDGIFGTLTEQACIKNYLYKGKKAATHIKWLQTRLVELGYDLGSYGVDGVFGNDTLTAVKKFQTDKKIGVDGIAGIETHKKLVE